MGVAHVLNRRGDTETKWDPDVDVEVQSAEHQFADMVHNKKYLAFRMDPDGKRGDQLHEFDKMAAAILYVPAMAGG